MTEDNRYAKRGRYHRPFCGHKWIAVGWSGCLTHAHTAKCPECLEVGVFVEGADEA